MVRNFDDLYIHKTDISKLNISEINTNISNSEIEINDNNSSSIKVITATTPTAVTPSAIEITFTDEASKDSPNSNVVVKPSGFTCKRITFDEPSDLNKNSNDLSSELERRKKRAERFGTQLSEADKKLERAARFGFAIPNPLDSQLKSPRPSSAPKKMSIVEDEEKLKKRAERFGTNKSTNETTEETTDPTIKFTSPLSSLSEEEKKKKRAERFSSESKSLSSVSPTSLNTISEEEKMKNRAEKFKTNTNDEPPSKKIKT
ncbi:4958_t:CDS:2 [Entrophospora sp. SA101]|nr:4958_t:CDS:2 [Entrophospora sp. SA101]CAJ0921876.1 5978_t:CDS:2 [Entrophospora sp. SA101]